MKKISSIALFVMFASLNSFAQKQLNKLPYNKERLDSIFRNFPKLNQPFVVPTPKGYVIPYNEFSKGNKSFEELNPGATIINKTNKGIIYNMPLDNMAVLVPDMYTVENMSLHKYKILQSDDMPNPLSPVTVPKKRDK